jgi:hypothetical protein
VRESTGSPTRVGRWHNRFVDPAEGAMALHHDRSDSRTASRDDLIRALVLAAAVIVLMAIATVIFGVDLTGPSLEFAPDPAGAMPF